MLQFFLNKTQGTRIVMLCTHSWTCYSLMPFPDTEVFKWFKSYNTITLLQILVSSCVYFFYLTRLSSPRSNIWQCIPWQSTPASRQLLARRMHLLGWRLGDNLKGPYSPDFLCCCPLDTGNWMRNCFDCSAVFSCSVFTGSCTEFCHSPIHKHFNNIPSSYRSYFTINSACISLHTI